MDYLKKRVQTEEKSEEAIVEGAIKKAQFVENLVLSSKNLSQIPEETWTLNIKNLDLSKNQIQTVSPLIGQLGHLHSLDLSSNYITEIPFELIKCLTLSELNLCRNKLSQFFNFPNENNNHFFKHLRMINLDGNQIKTFPDLSFFPNLEKLSLANNKISCIPENLYVAKKLGYLNLDSNQIETLPVQTLQKCIYLVSLDVGSNDIKELPPQLGNVTTLQFLNIQGNPIRAIRRGILEKPTFQLLEYLRLQIE